VSVLLANRLRGREAIAEASGEVGEGRAAILSEAG
jgi:hypothetical protein